MTNQQFHHRLRWIGAGLVLAVTIVTLWAHEPQQFNRGINVTQGNIVGSRGYILSGQGIDDDETATAVLEGV